MAILQKNLYKKYIDRLNNYFAYWAENHTPPVKTSKAMHK
jgi:hypothetical protein